MIGKSVLGRYRIEERLGSGGFGSVYRAIDELKRSGGEDDSIAIKVVDAAALGDGMGALVQEVSRSHRVTHPNIVRVFDIHVDEGFAFITMELLRGMPLSQRIASGALGADSSGSFLPIAEVDAVARSISRALAHCHAQNLVHADVKPANIFLCSDGTVKLLDLGIAQITGSRGKLWGYTQDYASPEQMSGDLPDPRDDIFSLGCVLYECLTGPSSSPRSPSGTKRSSADRFDFSKLPRRYRKTLALAVAPSREARLASVQTLWRRIDPAIRRRNAILAVASATALVASLFAYQNVRRTTVAEMVNEADQAAAETAFQNAIALATDRPDEARAALLEAIETNPFHEEAADVLAGWVRGASYVDALAYNDVWIDYRKALKAAPNSEPLQDLAHEQIDRILDAEVRTLPRSQVLSEFRTPLCVLPESGYRSEELVRLRADLAIRC